MGATYLIFQQTMLFTIPLMIVALGGMSSERSGMVSTVLRGIMIMGALTGTLFLSMIGGRMSGQTQLLPTILISTATGTVFAFFHAYASIDVKADQTVSRTVLNMFTPAFAIFVTGVIWGVQQIQFSSTFRIESVPLLDSIPFFEPLLFQDTCITAYLDVVILILSTLVFYQARFGLRLRSCGEYPQAADTADINVCRMQYAGVLISEILGGLRGLVFVVPTSTNFSTNMAGYGFLALAVLISGQWRPVKIMRTSLFPGFMKMVATAYPDTPFLAATGIPSYVYKMIPYVATLIVLVSTFRNSQAPRVSGVPYDKGQR